MRDWVRKTMAAVCASAPLLVLLMLSLVNAETEPLAPRANDVAGKKLGLPAVETSLPGALAKWLEQASSTYQSDVAMKLSVPRYAGLMVAGTSEAAAAPAARSPLSAAIDAALGYIAFWIEQAYRMAGYPPLNVAYSAVALVADETARDARAFVEARKKAEADWNEAVERANAAAAEAARQERERKSAAERDAAEVERRRAEARKEELKKLKEDLDRRIQEGLKKLEELEKLDATKKTETTRKALVADVARVQTETRALKSAAESRRSEIARKEIAERRLAEAQADYVRQVAAAEAARKSAAAEQARKAEEERKAAHQANAAEEARRVAEEKRLAEAKVKEARKAAEAEAMAARKAQAAHDLQDTGKAAGDERVAEAQTDYARRVAAAEAARKTAEAELARKVEEERRTSMTARKAAEAEAAREAEMKEAEVKAIEQRRRTAAEVAEDGSLPGDATASRERETAAGRAPDKVADARANPSSLEPAAAPRTVRRTKEIRTARADAKSHVAKPRRSAAKARYKRKKSARVRKARVHVVRRGETLWGIARRYLGDGTRYRKIYRVNRSKIRNPDRIFPCQRLRLP